LFRCYSTPGKKSVGIPAWALYGFSMPLDSHDPVSDALFCAGAWNGDLKLTSMCYGRMGR
jgi:hypothetical protein